MERRLKKLKSAHQDIVVLSAFLVILFLIQFPALWFPFHWDAISAVAGAAEEILASGFDPIPRTPGLDVGHPPVFTLALAVTWGILGRSLVVSHLTQLGFAFLAASYTYLLGKHLYDVKAGMLAALFLLLSPIFQAQTTNIYFDMPLTAFCIGSAYYAIRNRTWPYIVFATLAAFTKIYGGVICLPVLVYMLVQSARTRCLLVVLKRFAVYSVPLILLLAWVSYHRTIQGWAFIRPQVGEMYSESLLDIWSFFNIFRTLFFLTMGQSRWILTAGMLAVVVIFARRLWINRQAVEAKRFLPFPVLKSLREIFRLMGTEQLLLLLMIAIWSAFVASFFIPRYILPVIPLFILIGARSLQLVLKPRLFTPLSMLMVLFFWSSWVGIEPLGAIINAVSRVPAVSNLMSARGFESDYQFMDVLLGKGGNPEIDSELWDFLRVHQAAARYIETNYSELVILTGFPQSSELTVPAAGYVAAPLAVVQPWDVESCSDFDLLYWAVPSSWRGGGLSSFQTLCPLELVIRIQSRDVFAEIYRVER